MTGPRPKPPRPVTLASMTVTGIPAEHTWKVVAGILEGVQRGASAHALRRWFTISDGVRTEWYEHVRLGVTVAIQTDVG